MTADTVVFEIGGVLVDWQPHLAWADDLGENRTRVAQYIHRYTRTVPDKLSATWDPLYALKDKDVTLHAITDWSAEKWPEGLKVQPKLGEVFGTTVMPDELCVLKPSTKIGKTLCTHAKVPSDQCVYIDDGLHNCLGARAAGVDAIHFTNAADLRAGLNERALL